MEKTLSVRFMLEAILARPLTREDRDSTALLEELGDLPDLPERAAERRPARPRDREAGGRLASEDDRLIGRWVMLRL
jgi:hypothetical protein